LPEKSIARTSNVYVSLTRLLYVLGLVHGCQADSSVLSNRHSNVTGLALSAPVKRKTATLSVLGSSGASRMLVFGGIESPPPGPPRHLML
jgi:hypothetical protein